MPYRSMLDHFFSSQRPLFSLSNRVWNPPADVIETETGTILKIEVADLDMEALRITAERNLIVVRGCRHQPPAGKKVNYHLMEIHYGAFERVFAFSHTIDQNAIEATYKNGFLNIEVAKQVDQPRTVQVKVSEDESEPPQP